ncbi:hypothetical protein CAPTEDRAFT_225752 [Capitella teleta]|uniref:G-protein coupled receptors family 1 profile domain-containing protein n=1 Tax=Capitella teleta TaxID=283909 RepID=R7THW2_CAPTE|nr:hypothetical protein CAPTEDRAFT_225752 [Capitella teleta]|eukprot:ELT93072.1 hypothetical protein CAPTEDRAFT_225752 [Capitella teleta]
MAGNQSIGESLYFQNDTSLDQLHKSCAMYTFVMVAVITGILCVFGLIGNIVAFCVFRYDKMKTSTSFLFQGLAVIDSILLVVSIPLYSIREFESFYCSDCEPNAFKNAITVFLVHVFPIAMTAQTATVWVTVLVGFNRFIAVCKPYKAPRLCTVNQAKKQLAAVVICSILFNLVRFFSSKVVITDYTPDGMATWAPAYTKLGSNPIFLTFYSNVCYTIFLMILPLLILTVLNICLIRTLKELKRKRQEMQSLRQQQDNNVTFVLIIVVVVFIVCQVPALVTQILWSVLPDEERDCGGFQFYFSKVSNMLVLLNSSVNFCIYFLFNTRFRQILMHCCGRQNYQSVRTATASTMMTNVQDKKAAVPLEVCSDKDKMGNGGSVGDDNALL